MARTDGKKQEETLRVRLSTELMERIRTAKTPSGWGSEAESSFVRYLIELGLQETELRNEEKQVRAKFTLKRAEFSDEFNAGFGPIGYGKRPENKPPPDAEKAE
jgi:hypothetical protein